MDKRLANRRYRRVWGRVWSVAGCYTDEQPHLAWIASEHGRRLRNRRARIAWEGRRATR